MPVGGTTTIDTFQPPAPSQAEIDLEEERKRKAAADAALKAQEEDTLATQSRLSGLEQLAKQKRQSSFLTRTSAQSMNKRSTLLTSALDLVDSGVLLGGIRSLLGE